jgi:hypothetical protein
LSLTVAEAGHSVKRLSGADGVGSTEMGRRVDRPGFCQILADSSRTRSRCDGDHSGSAPRSLTLSTCRGGLSDRREERVPSPRGEPSAPGLRFRAAAPRGLGAKRGRPRVDLPLRGAKERGACAISARLAPRSQASSALLTEPETPSACVHARAGLAASGGRSRARRRSSSDLARRRPAGHGRTAPRGCSPWAHAGRDRRYTPSVRDIGRMRDRLRPARTEPRRERQAKGRSRRGRPWLQPRNAAPVFRDTSDTILATAASISASVSVRSRGCRVTWMATDFAPSGRPSPR